MKNIRDYKAPKYSGKEYSPVDTGVYEIGEGKDKLFVTSISFVQEPEYGEGDSAASISQYPLEDLLDKYLCYVSDYYDDINTSKSKTCYLELASSDKKDVIKLREIIGKHVYNLAVEEGEKSSIKLIIK